MLQLLHLHGACVLMGDFFLPENFLKLQSELSQLVEELRKGQPTIPIAVNQLQLNKRLTCSTFLNDLLFSWWSWGKLFRPHLHPNPELKHHQHLQVGDVCLLYRGCVGENWWLCVVVDTNDSRHSVKVRFRPRRHCSSLLYEKKVFIERLVLLASNKEPGGEDAEEDKHEDKLDD